MHDGRELTLPPGFEEPDWSAALDVGAALDAVPRDARTRGLYLLGLGQAGREHGFELAAPAKLHAFGLHPLREFMLLAVEAAERLYPERSLREGLRRLGHLVFPAFASTLLGRLIYGVLGRDLANVFRAGPRGYAISLTRGQLEVVDAGPRGAHLWLRDVYNFADSYHLGLLESIVTLYDHVGRLGIRRHGPALLEVSIAWRPLDALSAGPPQDDATPPAPAGGR